MIRRKCSCGCGSITNPGCKYIYGHNRKGVEFSKEHKKKLSLANKGMKFSEESKKKNVVSPNR